MIYPIIAYGDPMLRKKTSEIKSDYSELAEIINNLFETMYNAHGVGLAAPQIGLPIRLFVIDTGQILNKDDESAKDSDFYGEVGVKQVFINAKLINKKGGEWDFNEGCLSVPTIREDVTRPDEIHLRFYDENFLRRDEIYSGFNGRVIQHEYDHIEGILFTDHLKPLKKRLLKNRLLAISRGDVEVDYKMRFPSKK